MVNRRMYRPPPQRCAMPQPEQLKQITSNVKLKSSLLNSDSESECDRTNTQIVDKEIATPNTVGPLRNANSNLLEERVND